MSQPEHGAWGWIPEVEAAASPTSQPAAAAVTLGVERDALASNVELLRRLNVSQLDNLAQAVGLAERLREAVDTINALDSYLAAESPAL